MGEKSLSLAPGGRRQRGEAGAPALLTWQSVGRLIALAKLHRWYSGCCCCCCCRCRYQRCSGARKFRPPVDRMRKRRRRFTFRPYKLAFHDADTDTLARILADTSDTRDFLKLFLRQAGRHADILATILARMSARMSASVLAS